MKNSHFLFRPPFDMSHTKLRPCSILLCTKISFGESCCPVWIVWFIMIYLVLVKLLNGLNFPVSLVNLQRYSSSVLSDLYLYHWLNGFRSVGPSPSWPGSSVQRLSVPASEGTPDLRPREDTVGCIVRYDTTMGSGIIRDIRWNTFMMIGSLLFP